jgi:long-chain acyl-CoA synthetase
VKGGGGRFFAAFEELRRVAPDAVAVLDVATRRSVTRDGLARRIEGAASALAAAAGGGGSAVAASGGRAAGAGGAAGAGAAGRAVAVRVPNSPELFAAVLGCWAVGAVPLLVDAELAGAEADAVCRRLGIAWSLVGPDLACALAAGAGCAAAALPPGAAVLKLTSGTTGEPRAVAVTGDALAAGVAQIVSTMGLRPDDANLVPIPLAHSYGFDNVVVTLATIGCSAVLVRDLTPQSVLAAGRETRATVLPAVPFLLDVLSRSPSAAGGAWPELRLVISAGAPLPIETRERFAASFGVRPRAFYGATECGGMAFDREGTADVPAGCVGSALDGVALELCDVVDGVGRVRARSRSVAAGYAPAIAGAHGAAAAARGSGADAPAGGALPADAVLGDGWLLTADLGRIDARGRLVLLGRAGDVINVGGRKVFPAEVERVIAAIPGVRDVAVVGVARSAVAEGLRAVVVADDRVERAAVIAACEAALARYKVPRSVEFRDALPRNPRGKLDRRRLTRAR